MNRTLLAKTEKGKVWHIVDEESPFVTFCKKSTTLNWNFIDVPFEDVKLCKSCKTELGKLKEDKTKELDNGAVHPIKRHNPLQTF